MHAINPVTGVPGRDYEKHTQSEIMVRVEKSATASKEWRKTPWSDRTSRMLATADVLRDRQPDLSRLMTEEMGKPISQSHAEIDKCAWVCEYYAEHGKRFLAKQIIETEEDASSYVRFDPLGPVLAIMPWNFPFWQVFRFAAPALVAGNVGLLKHAANVPGCAMAIEEIFRDAGFPEGTFTTLLIGSDEISDVIGHPAIRAVTLTGSERAGQAVAAEAGKQLKKTVLELGGSDPFIVLADADLPEAARQAVKSRTINSGQSCIAAKRFIIEESVFDQFTEAFVEQMNLLRVGNPMESHIDVGPLARAGLRETLHDQVTRTVNDGARLLLGGEPIDGEGFFYPPTVLADVSPGMAAFDEETFGPVAALVTAKDPDHAAELANQSRYGLGASVWSRNRDAGEALAERIDAGCVFVNEFVKSDPRLPFGGVKKSGYGREMAEFGIREFTNIKTVRARRGKLDPVQEASEESFPASDPPAWTA